MEISCGAGQGGILCPHTHTSATICLLSTLINMSEDEQRNVSAEYDGSCEDNKAEALANGASDVIVVGK